ncbi:hypothetical protein [Symbioplanes lichenis]|uniref:hypothetical protein n=1 Tax=Symbioplanes lichenis TaxID=1629072 RepID=UPI002739AC14|nr:hypothetical protein [Actinoplanes lichenis]
MQTYGITYDTGWTSGPGPTTYEPFDAEVVRADMIAIRDQLHCDAVRVTGGLVDRLELAAQLAADAGLEVWLSPFTSDQPPEELLDTLADCARRAEKITGAEVVLVTGAELTLFLRGLLPGDTLEERIAGLRGPRPTDRLNAFLAEAAATVRKHFSGRITYAALPSERVDWTPFDIVGMDLYRTPENAEVYVHALRVLTEIGKPVAITEFGCTAVRGGADLGAKAMALVDWDGQVARGLTADVERDEEEQATYLRDLVETFEAEGIAAAFWCTFASRNLPHRPGGGRADLDQASYGLVKVLESGEWEPKAAFAALAAVASRDENRR